MNLKIKITTVLFAILVGWMIVLQSVNYSYPKPEEIEKRINYLQRVIHQPLEPGSEIMTLGNESQEFMLFSCAYSAYAMTNLAIKDAGYKPQAIHLIKESISKVLEYEIHASYGIDESIDQMDSIPDYSVLYLGHLNLMMGCFRLLSDDTLYNTLNDKISGSLYQRYSNTKFLNLESYSSSIWIPDNTVAVASLKLHSVNAKSNYSTICDKWTKYAKAHFLDSKTGVLYSTVDPKTGEPMEEPRGSMLGWSIMFIYQFDEAFAVELYNNYKKHFSNNLLIFRLFRERHDIRRTSMGDIDSGPVFLGYSIPANEFALGNSILAGDFKTAKKLERLIGFGTNTITKNNEIRYKVRFVNMNISPMAEALVLNSLTITKWTDN
ncbi:MAG: hypothetical protein AB9834_13345 [Lentimicrobium sp.]